VLRPYGVIEMVRTGRVSMVRGAAPATNGRRPVEAVRAPAGPAGDASAGSV
jgi:hypothetical protein